MFAVLAVNDFLNLAGILMTGVLGGAPVKYLAAWGALKAAVDLRRKELSC